MEKNGNYNITPEKSEPSRRLIGIYDERYNLYRHNLSKSADDHSHKFFMLASQSRDSFSTYEGLLFGAIVMHDIQLIKAVLHEGQGKIRFDHRGFEDGFNPLQKTASLGYSDAYELIAKAAIAARSNFVDKKEELDDRIMLGHDLDDPEIIAARNGHYKIFIAAKNAGRNLDKILFEKRVPLFHIFIQNNENSLAEKTKALGQLNGIMDFSITEKNNYTILNKIHFLYNPIEKTDFKNLIKKLIETDSRLLTKKDKLGEDIFQFLERKSKYASSFTEAEAAKETTKIIRDVAIELNLDNRKRALSS